MNLNPCSTRPFLFLPLPDDYELEKTRRCSGGTGSSAHRACWIRRLRSGHRVNQIDDLLDEIDKRITKGDRVLVTTLTKRMAEEMDKYLHRINIKSKYIHSEVDTLERVEILRQLRLGEIDVLVGVNLLREGLDLPEVSLVAILDADKEGFLRNEKSLDPNSRPCSKECGWPCNFLCR